MSYKKIPQTLLTFCLLFFGVFTFSLNHAHAWFDESFAYRRLITVSSPGLSGSLENTPVLLKLTPDNFDYSHVKSDGSDIRLIGSNDKRLLYYHIEKWNHGGESLIWVNAEKISADPSESFFYLYYGNNEANNTERRRPTYNEDYILVHHFDDLTANFLDETVNTNTGRARGGVARTSNGFVGDSLSFDGVDDYVYIADSESLRPTLALTIEAWVRGESVSSSSSHAGLLSKPEAFQFRASEGNGEGTFYTYTHEVGGIGFNCGVMNDGKWHHVVAVYDSAGEQPKMRCYYDGVFYNHYFNQSGSLATSSFPLEVGRAFQSEYFKGQIDELKISRVARSKDYIKVIYESETGSLSKIGTEEKLEVPVNTPEEEPAGSLPDKNPSQPTAEEPQKPAATLPITLVADKLGLQGQAGWVDYTSKGTYGVLGDMPEGAFMGYISPTSPLIASIPLSGTITPGQYYIFIKGENYDNNSYAKVILGGSEHIFQLNDRDASWKWTPKGVLNVTAPADSITIQFSPSVAGRGERYLMSGLYLTSNPADTVLATDVITNLTYPTEMDISPAVKGNNFYNSSFETGVSGWSLYENKGRLLNTAWDTSTAYHGKSSFRLSLNPKDWSYGNSDSLISRIYRVKPNKFYTFSAWVKTDSPNPVNATMVMTSMFAPPAGYDPIVSYSKSFSINSEWQRVSVSGYLKKYPTSDYQFRLHVFQSSGYNVWVDAVQLEEGDLSDYAPRTESELGLSTLIPGNVFHDTERVLVKARITNNSNNTASEKIFYEVYDYKNKLVKSGSLTGKVAGKKTKEFELNLTPKAFGNFRVIAWLSDRNSVTDELVFSVVPKPAVSGLNLDSVLGMSPNFMDYQMKILDKLGVKWARAMSPGAFFRWSVVEPSEGQFVWYDEAIKTARLNNQETMATIGTNNYWPAWADKNGLPDLDKWENFVEKIITHYKDEIKYWEIWNEAVYSFSPEFYARMLERAKNAAHRVDPEAKLIITGGSPLKYIESVIPYLWDGWQDDVYAFSTHLYPGAEDATEFKTKLIDKYNIPVWNTESGFWERGFYTGANSNFFAFGKPIFGYYDADRYYLGSVGAMTSVMRNLIGNIGSGLSKYFYYDARVITSNSRIQHHPTIFELDDTVRVKAVAMTVFDHLLGGGYGVGKVKLAKSDSHAYLFSVNNGTLLSLWSTLREPQKIDLDSLAGSYEVYDILGNKISDNAPVFSRTPIYIKFNNPDSLVIKKALESASISQIGDKSGPKILISESPRGVVTDSSAYFRWFAIDDHSLPILTETDNILYSYTLTNLKTEWSEWSPASYVSFDGLSPGTYSFKVRAKDVSGNITQAGKTFVVSSGSQKLSLNASLFLGGLMNIFSKFGEILGSL